MPKCNKVKNPCKICLGPVTQKNGLQCYGACESWVHYKCLNYTPGKIKDIKAGIINVICPCPGCESSLPKEYRTDEPYSCTNLQCPAHQEPHCDNIKCPLNEGVPGKMNHTFEIPPCPLNQCGKSCKQYSNPQVPYGHCGPPPIPTTSSSDACLIDDCPPGCTLSADVAGDGRRKINANLNDNTDLPMMNAVEQMCNTVKQLANQINGLMINLQAIGRQEESGCPHEMCLQSESKTHSKPCFCPGNPPTSSRR